MFKDYQKYLSTSMKVYLFVLVIIFILKLVGLDYFGIDYNSSLIKLIDSYIDKPIIFRIVQCLLLFLQLYLLAIITTKKKQNKFEILVVTIINLYISSLLMEYKLRYLYTISSIIIFIIYFLIKRIKIKRIIFVVVANIILQAISAITRNNSFVEYSFTLSIVLNIDYMILLFMWSKIVKESDQICMTHQLHGSYSQKKKNLFQSRKKLQRNFQNNIELFKEKSKEEKLTIIIFIILSTLWNVLAVLLVLFIAFLNDTLIECIFILSSFWLSKGSFGKSFHFDSMLICFIVSNLSYFVLNRITAPLGISIIIPVLLGVGLSYVTSKFVKKTYKPLYRGMPEEIFEDTMSKVTEKDSVKYKICKEFYIDNESDLSLSFKYNYSVPGIRKIKERINDKIKGLN